ncbi:MAG: outer membrane protein assembly factor BamA [Verrucomicrobiota bacterium]
MAGIRRWATLAAAAWLAVASVAAAGDPVVSNVSFQVASPYQLTFEELYGLVTLKPGDPLTPAAVRESIRRLYTKTVFREVAAYVRPEGDKVSVLFYLRPVPLVGAIDVTGLKTLSPAQVIAATKIRRGGLLLEKDIAGAEAAVRSFLAAKGFTEANVGIDVSCNVSNGSARVRIAVREGNPAVVQRLEVSGASVFPRDRIAETLGVAAGKPFDFRQWEEGIVSLRKEYKKEGYLTVHVEGSVSRCESGAGLCPAVRVEEGTHYDVRWEGAREFSPERLSKVAGLYESEETTEAALLYDLKERLSAFYRREEYLEAQVDVSVTEAHGSGAVLVIRIQEGMKGYIKEIRFEGSKGIPEQTLLAQMLTRKRGVFHWFTGSGKYSDEEWNQDMKAVVGYYQAEGYVHMRVSGVDNQWDSRGGITKIVHVEEGPRYLLRAITFEGNEHFLRSELLALMKNREGRYVDYIGLERDQEAISTKYANSGFLDVAVEGTLDFDKGKDTVSARFKITEGPRYRLGSVVVQGNVSTRPAAVLRENPVRPGAIAGEEDLLKFQQAVYATGLYKSVRLQRVKHPSEGVVDLLVEVEEAMPIDVEFGGGYGTETGVRGSVSVKHRNLDGLGRSLQAQAMIGQKEQNYQLDLREPYVLGERWKWEGLLTASHLFQERPSFSLRKTALIVGIQEKILERSRVSLQYEFSLDDTFDVQPGAVIDPADQGRANIAALRGLLVADFRDDPFNPKGGTFFSAQAELGSELYGSQVNYWLTAGQASYYLPVVRRNSLAFSVRAGAILPYGSTEEVPIQKRFFAGGRTTVRGFAQDELGPKGPDGAPTGGNYQLILNGELRIPLQYGFLFAVFVDAGSVWLYNDPGNGFDLRETSGVSLRYITPVGPISVDYGWKLDRRAGESPGEASFTIGMVF